MQRTVWFSVFLTCFSSLYSMKTTSKPRTISSDEIELMSLQLLVANIRPNKLHPDVFPRLKALQAKKAQTQTSVN